MKSFLPFILLLWTIAFAIGENEPTDPLKREIPDSWSYKSFDEAVHLIEKKTGFKVSCPKDIAGFMHQMEKQTADNVSLPYESQLTTTVLIQGSSRGVDIEKPAKSDSKSVTTKDFLDHICNSLRLTWKFNQQAGTIVLSIPWIRHESRSAADLLHFVCKPSDLKNNRNEANDWENAFDALLSKPANFKKAWKVRQRVDYGFGSGLCEPMVRQSIFSVSKTKYIFVLICHPCVMIPGSGSASYYWFKEDGTLAGAGLMEIGVNSLGGATIDSEYGPHAGEVSELHLLTYDDGDFVITRFVLKDDGLVLKGLMNGRGEKVRNNRKIGQSLMPPDK
ncbi:MAG: hypothetical protein WCD79_10830 [Chthoniobacteraceae bacterium]